MRDDRVLVRWAGTATTLIFSHLKTLLAPVRKKILNQTQDAHHLVKDITYFWTVNEGASRVVYETSLFGEFRKEHCQMSLLVYSSLLAHKNRQKRWFSYYLLPRVVVKFVKTLLFLLKLEKKNVDCLWRMRSHQGELLDQSVIVCMTPSCAADGGDGLQIWRVAANVLSKQSRITKKE